MRKLLSILIGFAVLVAASHAFAQSAPGLNLNLGSGEDGAQMATAVKIFLFFTFLTVAPALFLTMTSFTRIVVVLSFLRQAIGVNQSPPNQILVGLALFLTLFLMSPVLKEVQAEAIAPLLNEQIDYKVAMERASSPLRKFMIKQIEQKDLDLMLSISKEEMPEELDDLSMAIMVPSFILGELKKAFEIGFLIYLPFVLIDMVVAMVLLTMGMMVLPPVIISLPFKLMLFVLVDGWNLVIGSLVRSFS